MYIHLSIEHCKIEHYFYLIVAKNPLQSYLSALNFKLIRLILLSYFKQTTYLYYAQILSDFYLLRSQK